MIRRLDRLVGTFYDRPVTATRAIREFSSAADPWPAIDAWATRKGYRATDTAPHRRLYRKGRGWFAQPRMVLLVAFRGILHLEAWLAKPWFDSGPGYRVPPEVTVEPGLGYGSLPRRRARKEVNELLEALSAEPITEVADPDDRLSIQVDEGITQAGLATQRGDFAAAVGVWQEVLPVAERRFGRLHGVTLTGKIDMSVAMLETGRTGEAITTVRDVIPGLEIVAGLDARWTLSAKETLAVALEADGRTTEAIDVARRAVNDVEAVFGPNHPASVETRERFSGRGWLGRPSGSDGGVP